MSNQEKTAELVLELVLLKTQIIESFYPGANQFTVDIVIIDLSNSTATVLSFTDTSAGKHLFSLNDKTKHYELENIS